MPTMRSLMKRYHSTTMVYHGEQWYTMVNCGIPWWIVVYHGKQWYTIVHITCNVVIVSMPWCILVPPWYNYLTPWGVMVYHVTTSYYYGTSMVQITLYIPYYPLLKYTMQLLQISPKFGMQKKSGDGLFSCLVQSLFIISKLKCTVIQGEFSIAKFIKKDCETI